MQKQQTLANKMLTVRDVVTIAIITVLYLIIRYIVAFITMPVTEVFMIASGMIVAFLCAPLYLVMANRVNKHGVFLLYGLLVGIIDSIMGYVFLLPYFTFCGLCADFVMIGKDAYQNPVRNVIGWSTFSLLYSFGNYITIWFAWDSYQAQALKNGLTADLLQKHLLFYTSPGWIICLSALSVAGAVLGCLFGNRLLNRHFKKAGVA